MKNNWKEEFYQKFGDFGHLNEKFKGVPMPEEVKDFIESLLAEQKKEILDLMENEVENIVTPPYPVENEKLSMLQDGAVIGFNDCRKDISTIINQLRV